MTKPIPGIPDLVSLNSDAFLKLSKIAFSSIERLTALNLQATRTALEENVARSNALLNGKDSVGEQHSPAALPGAAAKTAEAYFQEVQVIATETQQEVSTLLTTYLAPGKEGALPSAEWLKGFDVFKNFAQQLAAMTAASGKLVADATAQPERSHSRKTN
jgi:phasin family protein